MPAPRMDTWRPGAPAGGGRRPVDTGYLDHAQSMDLARALGGITTEMNRRRDQRAQQSEELSPGEWVQQNHVEISGLASVQPVFKEPTVHFEHPFLMRVDPAATRGAATGAPVFSFGIEMLQAGDTLPGAPSSGALPIGSAAMFQHVTVDAQVRQWVRNPSDFVTGAIVRIAAWAPYPIDSVPFRAIVHLSFHGYAAPVADDSTG